MMQTTVKNYLFIPFILLLISCSREGGISYNNNGGAGRNNCYEELGTFYDNFFSESYIKLKGKNTSFMISPLVIDGTRMFVTTAEGVVSLVNDLSPEWEYKLPSNNYAIAGMAADKELNLYIATSSKEIISLTQDGKLRWSYRDNGFEADPLLFDDLLAIKDGIIVSASNGYVVKIDFNGKKVWSFKHTLTSLGAVCSDDKGNIAIGSTNNEYGKTDTLYLLNSDGKLLWKKYYNNVRFLKGPLLYKNMIVLGTAVNAGEVDLYTVLAIDKSGKEIWKRELNIMPKFLSSDNEGNIYVVASNSGYGETISGLICIDKSGGIKWKLYLDYSIVSPVMVGKKNLAVYGAKRNARGVFFINHENGQYDKSVTLSEAPALLNKPFIMHDPAVAFVSTDKNILIKIDESAIKKILPW